MLDLWPFNDEQLVRLLSSLSKPVISSIGHETDVTLTDLAADYRVETPTAAANKVTPAILDYRNNLDQLTALMSVDIKQLLQKNLNRFEYLANSPALKSFDQVFFNHEQKLQNLNLRLANSFAGEFQKNIQQFANLTAKLDALSPLKVLDRGFSLTFKGDRLIKNAQQLKEKDRIKILFAKGSALAEIKEISDDRRI